jgi:Baseplate J-like protein
MGTNVPVITFGSTGFQSPSSEAILVGVEADFTAAFGETLNFNLNTPQGQLSSSEAAILANTYSVFIYQSQQTDPNLATGRWLDAIGYIYYLNRDPAEPTSLTCTCGGLAGVTIPLGALITDTGGNLYASTAAATIGVGGTVSVNFAAVVPGPTAVPTADAVSIYQAVAGWDTVVVASGAVGSNTETDAAFRIRRADSVESNSSGSLGSILGNVAEVSGVLDYWGYDNGSNSPATVNGVSIAANSIYICVSGGASQAVGTAIWQKKAPGCSYTGSTSVTVVDPNPLYNGSTAPSYTVSFQRPTTIQILFAITIVNSASVPSNATTLIQNAILSAFGGNFSGISKARIASNIQALPYVAAISALGSWAVVSAIDIGSQLVAAATFTGSITGTALSTSGVTGTIAIGQSVVDSTGVIAPGTTIVSGSGSSWVVSISQTVTSETMYGIAITASNVAVQANQSPQLSANNIFVTYM